MRQRTIITVIWLTSLLLVIGALEAYFLRKAESGVAFLLPEQRLEVYKPIISIYGIVVGGVLGAWYLKPFPLLRHRTSSQFAFMLACGLTIAYNAIVLYLLFQGHLLLQVPEDAVESARGFLTLFGFLVGPVNIYYFGAKFSND